MAASLELAEPSACHWAKRKPFANRDLENFRNNGMSDGLDGLTRVDGQDRRQADPVTLRNNWSILRQMYIPPWFADRVMHVGVGNPDYMAKGDDGRQLTHSDLSCLVNAWRLCTYIPEPPKVVVEIGGGFGCLAAMLMRMWDIEYHGVDLPQSLELQNYYLTEHQMPFTLHEAPNMPDVKPDLIINIRSMMEMTLEQVEHYFDWIQRQQNTWFYCVNSQKKYHSMGDWPFDDQWYEIINTPLIGQEHIQELLLKRR